MKNVLISFFVVSSIFCGRVYGDSAVYEITKGKNTVYLAGTIHLLREQDFPLPAAFDSAYKKSETIYFETDLEKARSPAFGERFAKAMMLPAGSTLEHVLTPQLWSDLQAYSEKHQFPLRDVQIYNAAMVSILMVLDETKKLGIGEGVDAHYDSLARQDKKQIRELESCDDVIAYMNEFAKEDPNNIINNALKDVEHIEAQMGKVIEEWKRGDLNGLEKDLADDMRKEAPKEYATLVLARNEKWLPQIEAMLKTPATEMVMVGSLHLSGKDGLLNGLKKKGYKVKAYKST